MKFRINLWICLFVLPGMSVYSQKKQTKLVVGIVVDQMRNDYIYRYWNRYGEGGFKRLVNEGFYCKNAHYNYVPTYTGPGHSSIYTGTTPRTHGIIANEWYSREQGKEIYCVADSKAKTVGSTSEAGKMSPHNQLSTTIGDELLLFSSGKSKLIGVALKDRSSILPVGHAKGSAAYWFDDATGNFISSDWYMSALPEWAWKYNEKKSAKTFLEKGWNTLYPVETYSAGIADNNSYELSPNKKENPVFPYEYKSFIEKGSYGILKATPWGNTITKEFAIEVLKAEKLGQDEHADMLCISFSTPDYVGHSFGIRSVEIEDIYLRLDKELEELLNALDKEVGKDNYSLFLTADHGAADVAAYLMAQKIPAGYIKEEKLIKDIKTFCKTEFGDSLVLSVSNQQVFLNESRVVALKLNQQDVENKLAAALVKMQGIGEAYSSYSLKYEAKGNGAYMALIANGFNFKRSGNVAFTYLPGWLDIQQTGTTHGAAYSYDTNVPLIFFGAGINKGESLKRQYVTEIAPTISVLLNNPFPNGCVSDPIESVLRK